MEIITPELIKPSTEKAITLVKVANPLNPMIDRESKVMPYFGESILDIRNRTFSPEIPVVVSLNGQIIKQEEQSLIFLRHGDYLVFYPSIEGGGGGGMLRMVAFLALAVISMVVAPYLAPLFVSMGVPTAMATGMAAMAINMVGGMLINALLPPPTTPDPAGGAKTTYGWSPKSTQQPGIPIQTIYGNIKSHGNIVSAYNDNTKNKSWANVLVDFGLGPIEDIYDYKINDQRQGNSRYVTFEERHGELYQPVISNFNDTVLESSYQKLITLPPDRASGIIYKNNVNKDPKKVLAHDGFNWYILELKKDGVSDTLPAGPWTPGTDIAETGVTYAPPLAVWYVAERYPIQVETAGNDFDALEIEFYFPKGLCALGENSEATPRQCQYDIQISRHGLNDWTSVCKSPKGIGSWSAGAAIAKGDIIVSSNFGLFRVVEENSKVTGTQEPSFPTFPYSTALESASGALFPNFTEAWFTTNGSTWVQADINRLNGNLYAGVMPLGTLMGASGFLYCKVDDIDKVYTKVAICMAAYVTNGGTGTPKIKMQFVKPKAGTQGEWTTCTLDSMNCNTSQNFEYCSYTSGSSWRTGSASTSIGGSVRTTGHWVRFYVDTATAYPTLAMFRYVADTSQTKASLGLICYADTRFNYSESLDATAGFQGYWSCGYFIPSGVNDDQAAWVEAAREEIYTSGPAGGASYSKYNEGQDGGYTDAVRKGSRWARKTGMSYVIPYTSMDADYKLIRATTQAFWHSVRTWRIYPHDYYDVRVMRTNIKEFADGSPAGYDQMYLSAVKEIYYDDFSYPRQALLGVKALATDKLSGSIDISAVIKGRIVRVNRPSEVIGTDGLNYRCTANHTSGSVTKPITGGSYSSFWDQGGSSAVENNIQWVDNVAYTSDYKWINEYSSNPAWVCYDVLSQPVLGMASEVLGTDDKNYECVISHTVGVVDSVNTRPITGSNYPIYWQAAATTGMQATWSLSTAYNARPVWREDGIPSSRLDITSWRHWANYCDDLVYDEEGALERRHEFHGVFEDELTLWESALKVCEMSRASLVWNGVNITVVLDEEKDLPGDAIQLFSSGNIVPDSFKEYFLPTDERISELEINYLDREMDWERNTISIYNPDYVKVSNKTTVEPLGITKQSQAWRHARYLINANKELKRTIEFETDLEAIAVTIGDVFYFQNDTPRWGQGGRLAGFTSPTTLYLDQTITMSASRNYGIMVRLEDDTIVTKALNSYTGSFSTVTCTTSFSGTQPKQFDPYSFGISGSEAKPFRVVNIAQSSENKAKISAVEYNAAVFKDDSESPYADGGKDDWEEPVPVKPVTNLRLSERAVSGGGTGSNISYAYTIDVSFNKPTGDVNYRKARIYVTSQPLNTPTTSAWVMVGETTGTTFTINNVKVGYKYGVIVTSVAANGLETTFGQSPLAVIIIVGVTPQPIDPTPEIWPDAMITGLQIVGNPNSSTFLGRDCKLQWNPPITAMTMFTKITPISNNQENILSRTMTTYGMSPDGDVLPPTNLITITASSYTGSAYEGSIRNITGGDIIDGGGGGGSGGGDIGTTPGGPIVKDYKVQIYNTSIPGLASPGGTPFGLLRTEYVVDTSYVYTYEKNSEDTRANPTRSFRVEVRGRDTSLRETKAAILNCYNPPTSAPTFSAIDTRTGFEIAINQKTDTDLAGYKVLYAQTLTNFSATATVIADGMNTKISKEVGIGKVWVQVQAYDAFGST
jgi:hypothetical protein